MSLGCGSQGATETESTKKITPYMVPPTEKSSDLVQLEKKSSEAREALAKNPKDANLTKAAVDAIYEEAEAVLVAPKLTPKEKYPLSLKLYREVVKLDPNFQPAKDSIKTIEDIYKSMGRPVPTG